jgi:two-component system, OmpR family, response regulator
MTLGHAMTVQDHILVVDDDREIRALLGTYLQNNGYRVTAVADGKGMWNALDAARVDLVILDVMLPGDDGFVLCRTLRARGSVPVIMLTAKGDDTERIIGLELGADDYLPKPFNPRELLARIKSVLRRHRTVPGLEPDSAHALRFAGWSLDLASRNLVSPQEVVVPLSGAEFRLLRVFLSYPNRVLSRDHLMDLTVGREADPFDRSVDVQVSRLRQRLGEDAREPAIIKTVRGEGYVLACAVEAA